MRKHLRRTCVVEEESGAGCQGLSDPARGNQVNKYIAASLFPMQIHTIGLTKLGNRD